ncbi:MAG: hypothetical protein HY744_20170 [Deltaproteobacteria bacterium]|nr:hypothetical protein [Deltaproteobacteria bacterium]
MDARGESAALGGLGAVALLAALPVALGAVGSPPEVGVTFRAPTPYEVVTGGPAGEVAVRPPDLLDALDRRGELEGTGPGIWLRSWRVTYGRQWEKEVTLPVVVGPLRDAAREPSCGYVVRASAGLFDPDVGAPAVRAVVEHAVRERWGALKAEARREGMDLEPVVAVPFSMRLTEGGVTASLRVVMADGAALDLEAQFGLLVQAGRLAVFVRSTRTQPNERLVELAHEAGLLGTPFRAFILGVTLGVAAPLLAAAGEGELRGRVRDAAEEMAEAVATKISAALGHLESLRSPLPGRPDDEIRITFQDQPLVTPRAVELRPCISVNIAPTGSVDVRIPGPPLVASPPPSLPPLADPAAPTIEVAASTHGLNQALYAAWQAGALRKLGEQLLSSSSENALVEKLAFDVTGVEPRLPPVVTGAGRRPGSLTLAAADLRLGTWDGGHGARDVVGHARVAVTVDAADEKLVLSGEVEDVRANCVERVGSAEWSLTPCLGDLVPVVRLELEGSPKSGSFDAGEWFRLLREASFGGARLDADQLRAEVREGGIYGRVRVRLEPRDPP